MITIGTKIAMNEVVMGLGSQSASEKILNGEYIIANRPPGIVLGDEDIEVLSVEIIAACQEIHLKIGKEAAQRFFFAFFESA